MAGPPTASDQRLLQLCRRLLRRIEDLHAQLDRLYGLLHRLCKDYCSLQEQTARDKQAHEIERTSSDVLFARAVDLLLERKNNEAGDENELAA
jgi:hypothetical protein